MSNKSLTVWLARDFGGVVWLFRKRPYYNKFYGTWSRNKLEIPNTEPFYNKAGLRKGQCQEYRLVAIRKRKAKAIAQAGEGEQK